MVRLLSLFIVLLVPNLFAIGVEVVTSRDARVPARDRAPAFLPEPDALTPRGNDGMGPPAESRTVAPIVGARGSSPDDTAGAPARR